MIFCRAKKTEDTPKTDYELVADQEWAATVAGFDQHTSPDGGAVTATGKCPHCRHAMSVELPIRARTGVSVATSAGASAQTLRSGRKKRTDKAFLKVAYCNCGSKHGDDRPEEVKDGCGSFGGLRVGGGADQPAVVEGCHPAPRLVTVAAETRKPSVVDVAWERRADQQEAEALKDTRATGVQWTATVGSLASVLTAVLVVKGPDDFSKVTGEVPLTWKLILGIGLTVIGVVCLGLGVGYCVKRWAPSKTVRDGLRGWTMIGLGVLVSASGIAFFVFGWEWPDLIIFLLAAALVLSALAIVWSAIAAYGLPARYVARSGARLRESHDRQRRTARFCIRASVLAAIAGLLAVGAAAGLTWTHQADAPAARLLVIKAPGAEGPPTVCGVLRSSAPPDVVDSRTLVIDEDGDGTKANVPVELDDIASLASVASCGE
jgi:hypothetical protein